jgi:hypothetical protein
MKLSGRVQTDCVRAYYKSLGGEGIWCLKTVGWDAVIAQRRDGTKSTRHETGKRGKNTNKSMETVMAKKKKRKNRARVR